MLDRPRHTHQLDYFVYEHDLRTREIPAGIAPRAQQGAGMSRAGRRTRDRRPPQKGDQRRSALLQSLDHHLQESSLDSINIADISRRAGVTRSAFYFYFENKAAAVAALMEELYDEVFAVSRLLTSSAGTPSTRIETMILGLFEAMERHRTCSRRCSRRAPPARPSATCGRPTG